jgi:membrane protein required for colicin V production
MEHNLLNSINFVDLGLVVALLAFIIAGIIRGFTSDLLGFGTWIGAFFMTALLCPYAQPLLRGWIKQPFFADLATAFILFLTALILLVALAKMIARAVRKSLLSGLDRTFGIVSGALRGIILLTLAYFVTLIIWKPGKMPPMMQEARLLPLLNTSGRLMQQYLIPEEFLPKQILTHLYGPQRLDKEDKSPEDLVRSLSNPKPGHQGDAQDNAKTTAKPKPSAKPKEELVPQDLEALIKSALE